MSSLAVNYIAALVLVSMGFIAGWIVSRVMGRW